MSAVYTKGTVTPTSASNSMTFGTYQPKCKMTHDTEVWGQTKCLSNSWGCANSTQDMFHLASFKDQQPTQVCNFGNYTRANNPRLFQQCLDNLNVKPEYCGYHRNASYVGQWGDPTEGVIGH